MCIPVSPEDARPGDLIFSQGTYSTTYTVTHVGIFMGDGMMINAGDPIKYANIETSYWQNHFYSFARLS
jgi:cell wall-associated NlpC family hydrolase